MAHEPLACERYHTPNFDAVPMAQDGFGSALGGAARAVGGALKSMTKPWQESSPGDPFHNPPAIPDKPAKDAEPASLATAFGPSPTPVKTSTKGWVKTAMSHLPSKGTVKRDVAASPNPFGGAQDCWKTFAKKYKAHGATATDTGPARRPYGL